LPAAQSASPSTTSALTPVPALLNEIASVLSAIP
jgi:hypothetical protein